MFNDDSLNRGLEKYGKLWNDKKTPNDWGKELPTGCDGCMKPFWENKFIYGEVDEYGMATVCVSCWRDAGVGVGTVYDAKTGKKLGTKRAG